MIVCEAFLKKEANIRAHHSSKGSTPTNFKANMNESITAKLLLLFN
jgi:hypothetical protein